MKNFYDKSIVGRYGYLVSSKAAGFPFPLSYRATRWRVRVHYYCPGSKDSFLLIEPVGREIGVSSCSLCCKMLSSSPFELCRYCSVSDTDSRCFWVPESNFVMEDSSI